MILQFTQKSHRFSAWRYSFGIKEKVTLLSFLAFREDSERYEVDANDARSLSSSAETRALLLCATAKKRTYTNIYVQMRVWCETIESVLRERRSRSSDRAGVPLHVRTQAPKLSRSPIIPHSSLYIEIALRPNRTHAFAFHRRCSQGKPSPILFPLPVCSYLTDRLAGPDLCGLPVLPPGPI